MSNIEQHHQKKVENSCFGHMQLHHGVKNEPKLVYEVLGVLNLVLNKFWELEAVLDLVQNLEVTQVKDDLLKLPDREDVKVIVSGGHNSLFDHLLELLVIDLDCSCAVFSLAGFRLNLLLQLVTVLISSSVRFWVKSRWLEFNS